MNPIATMHTLSAKLWFLVAIALCIAGLQPDWLGVNPDEGLSTSQCIVAAVLSGMAALGTIYSGWKLFQRRDSKLEGKGWLAYKAGMTGLTLVLTISLFWLVEWGIPAVVTASLLAVLLLKTMIASAIGTRRK